MRTQARNPAIHRFKNLLSKTGRYPAKFVDILWNYDEHERVREVEVVFIPRRRVGDDKEALKFWKEFAAFYAYWVSSLGNSSSDWLQPGGRTPEGVFRHLLMKGFASPKELERALEEFSYIEECNWARGLLEQYRN